MVIELYRTNKNINFSGVYSAYKIVNGHREKIVEWTEERRSCEENFYFNYSNGKKERTYHSMYPIQSELAKKLTANLSYMEKVNATFIFDENNQIVGRMMHKKNKLKGKLIPFYSVCLEYKDRKYNIWEVGFGTKGQYYVICDENERTIAIIQRAISNPVGTPDFILYSEIEDAYELLYAVVHYFRIYFYRKIDDIDVNSSFPITTYKEVKSKYDPEFIQKIKQKDGIID